MLDRANHVARSGKPPAAMLPMEEMTAIDALKFRRRRESWVARSPTCFYKIIRKSDDPLRDFDDSDCIETAFREYTDMHFLHRLSPAATRPERVEKACIVYPWLSGPDMRDVLLGKATRAMHGTCLHDAMRLLGRLHHGAAEIVRFPVKDYRQESFLPPTAELLERMEQRERTLVVTGFEARNFRFDKNKAAWMFFDPHHLWLGCPEEDFARFVVSLLMIRGKRGGPRPWKGFDRFELLSAYEKSAPMKLDRKLLNYFLREQLAKRRFHAMNLAWHMSAVSRAFGVAYTKLYYHQLRRTLASQQL